MKKRNRLSSVRPDCTQFAKIIFETARRNYFDYFAQRVARVPERMPLPSRLEYPCPWLGSDNVVTEQRTEGAAQHIGIFIFAVVTVQGRRQRARGKLVMDYGESAAGLITINLPVYSQAISIEFFTSLSRKQQ